MKALAAEHREPHFYGVISQNHEGCRQIYDGRTGQWAKKSRLLLMGNASKMQTQLLGHLGSVRVKIALFRNPFPF